jgi:hypothetical protein
MIMRLEHPVFQSVMVDQGTGAVLATTQKLDLGERFGPRINLAYMTEEGSSFEVGYFGVFDWESRFTQNSAGFIQIPNTLAFIRNDATGMVDYNSAHSMTMDYRASLNSAELNLGFRLDKPDPLNYIEVPSSEILFGFRFIELDEAFDLTSSNAAVATVGPVPNAALGLGSQYSIRARNQLFGGQIGSRIRRCLGESVFTAETKIGIYNNSAKQVTVMNDDAGRVLVRDFATEVPVTCTSAELNLSLARQINQTWSAHAGYSLLWLSTLARAPDQLDFNSNIFSGSALQFRSGALCHGATLGVEAKW